MNDTWQAVIADENGHVYNSTTDALNVLWEDDEIRIRVVRGTAAPWVDVDGGLRMPHSYSSGDVASDIECYLVDDDESVSAAVRFAQAKAMAAGLNTAEATR